MFFQPHTTADYLTDEFFDDDEEFDGIGSFFKKIGSGLKKVGKVALKVAPSVVGFIPGVGGALQTALETGLSAAGGLTGGGGGGGVAKGLGGITNFGNQIMQALDQIASNPIPENVAQAEKLVAALSDGSQVYQAKNGKDGAALADFKQKAAAKLSEIKQLAAQNLQNQNSQNSGGLFSSLTGGASGNTGGGIDTGTILLFGGGGLALVVVMLLLTRK